jgi:hypothetical protein
MDEFEFIREYMAVMCCSERSALDVFILHEVVAERSQPAWLDHLSNQAVIEPSRAET